ncbi:hypothetical protein PZE06_15200 [Robertmurraya sp. DFI.2.37]|uniref:hypothetical protein n=1 Tax=Robertmurraya sp. DFI.2.37 TaxID=3031819 RepID=UPI0012482195|nr:hypothetical protein [Robertmurraya sp. DFI.2.37]MDF1509490.1 hypothetical protein [Robertmurraya sp. DFI.2.37]
MKQLDIFRDCLLLPKKEAVVRLNRIDLKEAAGYFFILLLILVVPLQITLLQESSRVMNEVPAYVYKAQILILYPFFIVFYAVIGISLLSFLSVLTGKWLKRRLKFQLLWKMIAFTLTKPLLLYVIAYILVGGNTLVNLAVLVGIFSGVFRLILSYPKRKL